MRLLLLCLLATAAAAGRDERDKPSSSISVVDSFKPGYLYKYSFHGQIISGLPVADTQNVVTIGQADLLLSFTDHRTAIVRIEKIRAGSIQKEISEPTEIKPFDMTEPIQYSTEQHRLLNLPVRFRYDRGLISDVEFDNEDNEWSENIKKGILNLLQVNMDKKNMIETPYPAESGEGSTSFTAPETTVEGECETVYSMVSSPSSILVSKSVSFERCSSRVGLRRSFRFGDECPSCENKFNGQERNIESSSITSYRIRGNSAHFVIDSAESRSVYNYVPLSTGDAFFQTSVSCSLSLVEVTSASSLAAPSNTHSHSLLYSLDWEQAEEKLMGEGDESLLRRSPYPEIKNRPELLIRLLKGVQSGAKETGVEVAATHEMARLVKVLRLSTKGDLRRLHEEVCEGGDEQLKEILNEGLAMAASALSVAHLVDKMVASQVSAPRAALLLKHMALAPVPSATIALSLLPLCRDSPSPLLRQSCWLTFGSIANGVCGEHREQLATEKEKRCPRDTKEKLLSAMEELYKKASTRYEKILALKAIGNSGMDLIVFPLQKVIGDLKEEKMVRNEAIAALRKLRNVMPRKMHSILLPILKNTKESPEVRVAAFHSLISTLPPRPVIDQMTEMLMAEPSHQVHSLVYSALLSLSHSTLPCHSSMAASISSSLSLARLQPRKTLDSVHSHLPFYSSSSSAGASLDLSVLFSNDSILPKEAMASLETVFLGQWHKYFTQIGFSQENMESLLSKVMTRLEEEGLEKVLVRGKRDSFSWNPTEYLKELARKLRLATRSQSETEPHGLIFLRHRDMDYALLPLDEESLPAALTSILSNGRLEVAELESLLSKGVSFSSTMASFVYERSRQIVTSVGFPLSFSSKMPTVARLSVSLTAEVFPKGGSSFEGLSLRLKASPSIATTHISKMDVLSPLFNQGAKLIHSASLRLPVDLSLEMESSAFKASLALPSSGRILSISSRPSTFLRLWPADTRVYIEPKESTIRIPEYESLVVPLAFSSLKESLGLEVVVDGHVHGHLLDAPLGRIPSALLVGDNHVEVSLVRDSSSPSQIVWKMMLEKARMEKAPVPILEEFFDGEDDDDHFNVDSNENSRRTEFRQYIASLKGTRHSGINFISTIETSGGRNEKKAQLEMKMQCEENGRHCHLALIANRSPMAKEEKEWNMGAEAAFVFPSAPSSLLELAQQKHREMMGLMQVGWGEEKNIVKMRVQGQQNEQQRKWIEELKEDKDLTPIEERTLLVEASALNEYKIVASSSIASSSPVPSALYRIYSMGVSSSPLLSSSLSYSPRQSRGLRAFLSIDPQSRRFVNLSMESSSERFEVSELGLPFALGLSSIHHHHPSSLLENSFSKCVVESSKVSTFDSTVYRAPLTTCYSVLAKDCSSPTAPQFAVLMRKINKENEDKKIRIVTPTKEIVMEKKYAGIEIRVNQKKITEEKELERHRIHCNGKDIYIVKMDQLTVEFDGFSAHIKMSETMKNKQCGVCGHFDGESGNDFRGASDSKETKRIAEFHQSFLDREDECDAEKKIDDEKNYKLLSRESSSEEHSIYTRRTATKEKKNLRYEDDVQIVDPVEKTLVQEYSSRICFSSRPVPECPRKSFEKETKRMEVKFSCVPRSSSEASRLSRQARDEVLSLSLPVDFTESLSVPRSCAVY